MTSSGSSQRSLLARHLRIWAVASAGYLVLKILDGSGVELSGPTIGLRAAWHFSMAYLFGFSGLLASLVLLFPFIRDSVTAIAYLPMYIPAYAAAAYVLRRWSGQGQDEPARRLFLNPRTTLLFLFCCLIPSAVTTILAFEINVDVPEGPIVIGVLSRWLREASGIAALAPFFLVCLEEPLRRWINGPEKAFPACGCSREAMRDVAAASLLSVAAFWVSIEFYALNGVNITYITFLPLLLASVRSGLPATSPSLAISALVTSSMWLAFGWQNVYAVAELRVLVFISAFAVLVLAAIVEQQKEARTLLDKSLSERIELERRLQHSEKMETLGRLAAGVAHDFNNFLTVIRGYSDLAGEEISNPRAARESLGYVQQACGSAAKLVEQLLAFSQKRVTPLGALDLTDVIHSSEPMLKTLLGRRIELEVSVARDLRSIQAERVAIEQALLNLASNSRDAMTGGGRFTIRAHNVNGVDSAPFVEIEVSDTGPGIPPDVVDRIFEPFFTTKAPGKGTGMGLAMIYGAVTKLGGTISVETAPEQGVVFRLAIPADRSAALPVRAPQPASTIPLNTATVLVVDDQPEVRSYVVNVARSFGCTVLEAADGREALELAKDFGGTVHILVSDIVMPGIRGTELADTLRDLRPDIAVLLLSAYAPESVSIDPARTAFLPKPFTRDQLRAAMTEALTRKGPPSATSYSI